MQFGGNNSFHAWRIAFWVIIVVAAVASGARAILG